MELFSFGPCGFHVSVVATTEDPVLTVHPVGTNTTNLSTSSNSKNNSISSNINEKIEKYEVIIKCEICLTFSQENKELIIWLKQYSTFLRNVTNIF